MLIDISSTHPDYYNPLHYLPVLVLGITALIGISLSDKKSYKLNYLILIFFENLCILKIHKKNMYFFMLLFMQKQRREGVT